MCTALALGACLAYTSNIYVKNVYTYVYTLYHVHISSSWLCLELVYLCVCLCRSSAGIQQSLLVTESVQDTGTEWLEYVDPNEPRYCLCNQVGATISHSILSCNCYGEIFIRTSINVLPYGTLQSHRDSILTSF